MQKRTDSYVHLNNKAFAIALGRMLTKQEKDLIRWMCSRQAAHGAKKASH